MLREYSGRVVHLHLTEPDSYRINISETNIRELYLCLINFKWLSKHPGETHSLTRAYHECADIFQNCQFLHTLQMFQQERMDFSAFLCPSHPLQCDFCMYISSSFICDITKRFMFVFVN